MLCPWCGALADDPAAKKCPRCGAVYAKAAALVAGLPALPAASRAQAATTAEPSDPPASVEPTSPEDPSTLGLFDEAEQRIEHRLRIWALPSSLALAVFFHSSNGGRFLQRIVFTRLLHELGHAVTAWFCGFSATPLLWVTYIGETRSALIALMVGAASASLLFHAVPLRNFALIALGSTLALAQLIGTLVLSTRNAQALITFGGDAGAMLIGSALMAAFVVGEDTSFKRNQLRWGFLVIGSAAYVDTFATWWAARHDWEVIPFGEIEGVGLSDPTKLIDVYGWSVESMVQRYVTLGVACTLVFSAAWIWGIVSSSTASTRGSKRRIDA
jgi:hypothetical protein